MKTLHLKTILLHLLATYLMLVAGELIVPFVDWERFHVLLTEGDIEQLAKERETTVGALLTSALNARFIILTTSVILSFIFSVLLCRTRKLSLINSILVATLWLILMNLNVLPDFHLSPFSWGLKGLLMIMDLYWALMSYALILIGIAIWLFTGIQFRLTKSNSKTDKS